MTAAAVEELEVAELSKPCQSSSRPKDLDLQVLGELDEVCNRPQAHYVDLLVLSASSRISPQSIASTY